MDRTRYSPAPQDGGHVVMDMCGDPNIDRDTNIFALDDAAAHLDDDEDIDDIFAGFGLNLSDIVQQGGPSKITTKTLRVPNRAESQDDSVEDKRNSVQISTISQKFDNGRSVHTKVVRGPVQCKKRLVKISRETPGGLEVLAEVEAPGDADINSLLASALPKSLGISTGSMNADYDNLDPTYIQDIKPDKSGLGEDDWVGLEEDVARARADGRLPPLIISPPSQPTVSRESPPKPILKPAGKPTAQLEVARKNDEKHSYEPISRRSSQSSQNESARLLEPGDNSDSDNRINQSRVGEGTHNQVQGPKIQIGQNGDVQSRLSRKRTSRSIKRRGSHGDSLRRKSVGATHLPEEEFIQLYEPPETDDGDDDSDDNKGCLSCCCTESHRKRQAKKQFAEFIKGKSGMTNLHAEKEVSSLPGIKALVANYAKMLHEDRAQFVDTMFRAVKLNNVDVTRILCKIVQKSGFKLSQFDLREPESSATILHVALLYNHEDIVRMLLKLKDIELVVAKYESYEYRNQTGLHLAVANENPELIEQIVTSLEPHDRVALINTIADGKYFKSKHPDGQLALTAAAWAGNAQVIKTLVRYGAQLSLKNDSGNTLLHSIILQSVHFPDRSHYERLFDCVWEACGIQADQLTVMYDTKFQKQKELKQKDLHESLFRDLLKIRNDNGYTPLALAVAKMSRLFNHIINMEKIFKIPQNKLGSIAWVTYDVTDISSFGQDKYNKFSVLHILAHNSQQLSRHANLNNEDEDFLEMEPIQSILTSKWSTVYRWIYIFWMVIHTCYMLVFTACTVKTNSLPIEIAGEDNTPVEPQLWLIFFMILPSIYMLQECLDIGGIKPYRVQFMSNQNILRRCLKCLKSEWTITGNGPYRLVMFGFSSFTLQWFILYLDKDARQDIALSMSLLLGWIFVLFFTRACRVTCRFTIMIQKMFFRDLIYFLTVYGIILIAFSFSMNALFSYGKENRITQVLDDMMNVVTDLDSKPSKDGTRHPMFIKLLLILYAIIAVILLMNMLIAMMNTSYETIRVTRCNLWKQQQLSILLMLERRFFFIKYLCKKSEGDTWKKEVGDDKEVRTFMDVTMLNHPGLKADPFQKNDAEPKHEHQKQEQQHKQEQHQKLDHQHKESEATRQADTAGPSGTTPATSHRASQLTNHVTSL